MLLFYIFVLGFSCFECDGDSPPLCEVNSTITEMKHNGKYVECPNPNQTHIQGFNESSEYSCFIMKTVSHSTRLIEITKGCVLNEGFFVKGYDEVGEPLILDHGDCYLHNEYDVIRDVVTHDVTICICNPDESEDNCNENEIEGVGFDDIKTRLKRGKSGASEGIPISRTSAAVLIIILMCF